ncbi:MAG: gliding motility-associated C-terminal domain-containing protein, partial [Flavobacterium sp.]|nr:gliding motility-associated C-terminal domain-containing protein [Candidatus Neoflavobacterium equi]
CDTAVVSFTVFNEIEVVPNIVVPYTPGSGTTPNVTELPTIAEQPLVPVTPENPNGNVTIVQVPEPNSPITINPDGTLVVTPGTPSGSYDFEYTICEVGATPGNCENQTGTVIVSNTIAATNDTLGNVVAGTTTGAILNNDTFNSEVAQTTKVTIAQLDGQNLGTVNPDGSFTVAQETPAGSYEVTYQICEIGANPENCTTAIISFVVIEGPKTTGTQVGTQPGVPVTGQVAVTPGSSDVVEITTDAPTTVQITVQPDGTFTVVPGPDYEDGDVITINYTVVDENGLSTTGVITVIVSEKPAIALIKTAVFNDENADGFAQAGETVSYTFEVTNTGDVTLRNPMIQDAMLVDQPFAVTPSVLAPSEVAYITINYVLTQVDIDANQVSNTATVHAVDPKNRPVTDISGSQIDNDDVTVLTLVSNPKVSLLKESVYNDINNNGLADLGDAILYIFTVKNTGDLTLYDLKIQDSVVFNGDIDVNPSILNPGQTGTAQLMYALTQSDLDAGVVFNTAVVTGVDKNGNQVDDQSGTTFDNDDLTETPLVQESGIAIVKRVVFNDENQDGKAQVGETLSYSFEIQNTGTITLNNIVVTDDLPGISVSGQPIVSLAPAAVDNQSYTAVYVLTLEDLVRGYVDNQAKVTAVTPQGEVVEDLSDANSITGEEPTHIEIDGCKIEVFNAVSPDSDGYNDFLYIQGIECYPKNSIEIYNRWGVLVYDVKDYDNAKNAFKGYSEGRVTVNKGDMLPVGTYFYILNYVDFSGNTHKLQGYLYLNR